MAWVLGLYLTIEFSFWKWGKQFSCLFALCLANVILFLCSTFIPIFTGLLAVYYSGCISMYSIIVLCGSFLTDIASRKRQALRIADTVFISILLTVSSLAFCWKPGSSSGFSWQGSRTKSSRRRQGKKRCRATSCTASFLLRTCFLSRTRSRTPQTTSKATPSAE